MCVSVRERKEGSCAGKQAHCRRCRRRRCCLACVFHFFPSFISVPVSYMYLFIFSSGFPRSVPSTSCSLLRPEKQEPETEAERVCVPTALSTDSKTSKSNKPQSPGSQKGGRKIHNMEFTMCEFNHKWLRGLEWVVLKSKASGSIPDTLCPWVRHRILACAP